MVGQELVERTGRGHQQRGSRFVAAPRPTGLLPRRSDRPRIPDQQRRAQPADVNAQLEGVGGDDRAHAAVAQPLFDFPALGGQVAGAVAADRG